MKGVFQKHRGKGLPGQILLLREMLFPRTGRLKGGWVGELTTRGCPPGQSQEKCSVSAFSFGHERGVMQKFPL